MSDMVPPGVRLGIVRSISYGLFGKPDQFVPQLRELGATLVRVYFYWSQIEPEPGRFTFEAVDAFLDQLDGSEEVWVTVCSSSRWATRQATGLLPPSPARDPGAYRQFVDRLVRHCAGRVRYWQCDNEPSNVGLTWAGTAAEYVAQLQVLHQAVKDADPDAVVVLGGAPYVLPASAPDSPERQFFDVLVRDGRDFFDLFDLHLYGDASRIPADIEATRGMMRGFGYEKPLVVGEYNAPWPNLYPEATAAMEQVMAAAFASGAAGQGTGTAPQRTPEEAAMASLYEQMASLPPQLRMFMRGCPKELEDKRHRINCRELVMRNLLALSAGVRRTVCWNLAPDIPGYEDLLSVMDLCSRCAAAAGARCWWCGSSATPSPARTSRRWRSTGPGRRRRRPRSTPSAGPSRPGPPTGACGSRSRTPRCWSSEGRRHPAVISSTQATSWRRLRTSKTWSQ
jgi:hypothetical protein